MVVSSNFIAADFADKAISSLGLKKTDRPKFLELKQSGLFIGVIGRK